MIIPKNMKLTDYEKEHLDKVLEEDFVLDPLNRRDGTLTNFGKILLQLAKEAEIHDGLPKNIVKTEDEDDGKQF